MTRRPLFLARQDYRRRRLRDAARLLPVAGGVLFLMPLLLGMGTAGGGIYLFAVWVGLALAAGLLSRHLAGPPSGGGDGDDDAV